MTMASAVRRGGGYVDEGDDDVINQRALAASMDGGTPQAGAWDATTARGGVTGGRAPGLQPEASAAPAAAPSSATPTAGAYAPPAAAAAPTGSKWTPETVTSYFTDRGVQPFDTSVDYWLGKAKAFGDDFVEDRLKTADEFTGVGPNYDWTKGMSNGGGNMTGSSTVPLDSDFFNELMKQMRGKTKNPAALDNAALSSLM